MKLPLFLAAATLALASCEQVIDVPEPDHTPAIALSYTLSATTPPDTAWRTFTSYQQLYIGASQRLFDQRPLAGLTNATARLLADDGTVLEEFRPAQPYQRAYYLGTDTAGYYRPTRGFVGQPGGSYRLLVSAPGYATVESRLTLPPAPPLITAASFAPSGSNDYGRQGRLSVTVQDDPATTDYYLAYGRLLGDQGQPLPYSSFNQKYDDANDGSDADFNGGRFRLSFPGSNGNDLYPFADNLVSGRAFSLSAEVELSAYDPITGQPITGGQLEIVVARITREAYEHYLSRRRYYESDGNPFAEPAPIYSNISGGYGLFGGAVESTIQLGL